MYPETVNLQDLLIPIRLTNKSSFEDELDITSGHHFSWSEAALPVYNHLVSEDCSLIFVFSFLRILKSKAQRPFWCILLSKYPF